MRNDHFNCSTFRFNNSGQQIDSDMDGTASYRWFCIHVRNIIAIACGVEFAILLWMLISSNKYPLVVCQTPNTTVHETSHLRSPFQQTVPEHRSCDIYSPILIFMVFHLFCDLITLIGIIIRRKLLILPLLLLLVVNIIVSSLFLVNSFITYMFLGNKYDGYFVAFLLAQTIVRFYEFVFARRLYWYFKWSIEERYMPQSSLLRPEDESPFQF